MKIKLLSTLSVLGAAMLCSSSALAGFKLASPVVIGANFAQGTYGTARNSADTNQYLMCQVITSGTGTATTATLMCSASDATGKIATCVSTDFWLTAAAANLTESSGVVFQWDATGKCTALSVYNYSYFERPN